MSEIPRDTDGSFERIPWPAIREGEVFGQRMARTLSRILQQKSLKYVGQENQLRLKHGAALAESDGLGVEPKPFEHFHGESVLQMDDVVNHDLRALVLNPNSAILDDPRNASAGCYGRHHRIPPHDR